MVKYILILMSICSVAIAKAPEEIPETLDFKCITLEVTADRFTNKVSRCENIEVVCYQSTADFGAYQCKFKN